MLKKSLYRNRIWANAMTSFCQPLPQYVVEELLQVVTRAICDRPGDNLAQLESRTRQMVLSTLGMAPRDGLEFMLSTLAFGHFQAILDSMHDIFRGQLDTMKAKTKTTMVALDRAMLEMLRELRAARLRPVALSAEDAVRQAAEAAEAAVPPPAPPELDAPEPEPAPAPAADPEVDAAATEAVSAPAQYPASDPVAERLTREMPRVLTVQTRMHSIATQGFGGQDEGGGPDDAEFDEVKFKERVAEFQQLLSETQALLAEEKAKVDLKAAANAALADQASA